MAIRCSRSIIVVCSRLGEHSRQQAYLLKIQSSTGLTKVPALSSPTDPVAADIFELPFLAGINPDGDPVFESLEVEFVEDSEDEVRLVHSPLLTRNLAAGDKLKVIDVSSAEYKLLRRSGNLSIRGFRQHQLDILAESLTGRIEKLGGSLDKQTDRALVYSIHFSIGFQVIEELLSTICKDYSDTVWYYGNVYDPEDGTTALEWWSEFEDQE